MQCEKCGSENTQKLEMAFDGGTQGISTTSHTAGVGSLSGALGLGGSITKTSGTAMSVLAQKASPPAKRKLKAPIVSLVIGLLVVGGGGVATAIGLAALAAGGYFGYTAFQFNSTVWPDLYAEWQESWLCHKCGNIYRQA